MDERVLRLRGGLRVVLVRDLRLDRAQVVQAVLLRVHLGDPEQEIGALGRVGDGVFSRRSSRIAI